MIVVIVVKYQNKKGTKALIENKIHRRSFCSERDAVEEVKTIRKWFGVDRVPKLGYMYTFFHSEFLGSDILDRKVQVPVLRLTGCQFGFCRRGPFRNIIV